MAENIKKQLLIIKEPKTQRFKRESGKGKDSNKKFQ